MLTSIWWGLSYAPILTWYLWRRPGIREMMDKNSWYHRAWNTMWMTHYFVFQLPAIVSLMTFLGNQSINHFAILLNFWVGTVVGGFTAAVTTIMFVIALATYSQVGDLVIQYVVAELVMYIFLTFGLWGIA